MSTNAYLARDQMRTGKVPGEGSEVEIRPTICAICNPHSHCGIDAYVKDGVIIKVEGTKSNPHSEGVLCPKGAASREYIYHKERIRTPLLRKGEKGSDDFEPISWDEALDTIGERLQEIKKESGPESVAFYVGYTKWMRPFVKRLAHSFGSPNYCTESSTCFTATKVANLLNYGYFGPPELPKSKCLLVWSSNPFYTNPSTVRRLLDERERGLKIIEVGPLITPLTAHADIHLRMRPGTSGALAHAMAHVIIEEELMDMDFVENWTRGFEEYRAYVAGFAPATAEEITGVPAELIKQAARLYATTKPAGLMVSASPTVHHTNGLQNHRALIALIGLTGNFDREGGNYVSPPGWLYVDNGLVVRQAEYEQSRPWSEMAPRWTEKKYPVWSRFISETQAMELPFQIQNPDPYPIRAVVAFGMNYRMWPGSDFMYESLKKLDFMVHAELFMTDTCKLADIVLPACTSFERSELKFYAEDYVIWTTPVIEPLWGSRSDADIIFDLAKRIAPDDALMQKGYEANVDWILKPTGLKLRELKKYPAGYAVKNIEKPPYRKYEKSGFPTPSGKMELASTIMEEANLDSLPTFKEPKLSPRSTPEVAKDFPLILTTGARLSMYIHSRTFRLSWTRGLRPDPMLDINPIDADERGISQGNWVTLSTPRNSIEVKANVTEVVPPGVINIFHGYKEPEVNTLVEPDYLDPVSGFPGFKSLLCQVKKI
ncbi:MAG: molybdopterin-dependent oxidoreductase [Desulfobacteraceae bacterium]